MYLCIGEHDEAMNYQPRDLSDGKLIPDCVWADDSRGRYCVYLKDAKGNFILNEERDAVKTEVRHGHIKLERIQ